MNLIPVSYENNRITVLGRDLHTVLEIKTHYTDWFKRMCEYGFEENVDYIQFLEKEKLDNDQEFSIKNKLNHQMTLDMAKEIAMVQRSEIGRKVRKYFIEVEKKYKSTNNTQQYEIQSPRVKAIIAAGQTANALTSFFDVNQGIARVHALVMSEKEYDVDLSDVKKLLPAVTMESVEDLTPTLIAQQLTQLSGVKHSARQINTILEKMNFQCKDKKEWKLTELGKQYGHMYPYENNGHSGYQIRWQPSVLSPIKQFMNIN